MTGQGKSIRLVTEGVLIVVSILLAFAIDAAWAARGERLEARQVLRALHEEAVANQALIEDVIQRTEADYAQAKSFYEMPRQELQTASADLLQSLIRPNTTGMKMGALNGLTASGKLDIIASADLRKLLLDWQSAAIDLAERQSTLADMEAAVLTATGANADLQPWFITRGRPNETGQAEDILANGRLDLRGIRDDRVVLSALAAMQFERRVHILVLTELKQRLDELVGALSAALD